MVFKFLCLYWALMEIRFERYLRFCRSCFASPASLVLIDGEERLESLKNSE